MLMSCSSGKKWNVFGSSSTPQFSKSVDDDFAIKIFREGERLEREGEYLAAGDAFYLALTNGYPNSRKRFEIRKRFYPEVRESMRTTWSVEDTMQNDMKTQVNVSTRFE